MLNTLCLHFLGCRDRSFNCLHNIKFCKSYKDVQYYCPKSCGLCGTTTHSPTITKLACQDKTTLCRYLIQDCKTNTNVQRDCQKSCGLCGMITRKPTATRSGEDDREKASGSEQIISAAHFETHGKYNQPTNLNNDIALIRLSKPARLNKYVKPICLPLQGTKPGKAGSCYLSGWGKSTQPGQYVNRLHHAKLSIMESDKCKKSNSKYVPITPQMLCATGENMASGCYGDNGGPFVCQAANERWTLHGVFSWGSPRCSVSDAYSVFARVSSFRQWIDRFV
ncbi:chymotrypsin B-like isoform X2 [Hydractinia symbiolongicarpus]|uniref:chymotrypsin B-like isoform X2 n=1 Tax=Hydractinia symbiolongicarpus TaxID=13093 RepID=UPI0025514F5C|nr:chymotrypsin B-like isoform X2 [Hydractinia symbiolongicarpus]